MNPAYRFLPLLFLVVFAGCDPSAAQDPCDDLAGRSFRSTTKGECGGCPGGIWMCYWTVELTDDHEYTYLYSDIIESGDWQCDEDGTITTTRSADGSYDPDTDMLIWDGLEFEACEDTCDPEYEGCDA